MYLMLAKAAITQGLPNAVAWWTIVLVFGSLVIVAATRWMWLDGLPRVGVGILCGLACAGTQLLPYFYPPIKFDSPGESPVLK